MATTVLDTFVTIFEYQIKGADKLKKLEQMNESIGRAGRAMTARVTAPVIAGFAGMIAAATKFESGLDDVLGLLDATQLKKFTPLLEGQQKAAVKLGFSLEDVNKALFDNVSALGVGGQALDNFAAAQILAKGGSTSLGIAIDGQTSIINAYGRETTNATEVANAFFSAQKAGKTTVAELAANVGKVAPIAKQAGIGYKTLLSALSELTLGGLSTEESATALRGAIAGLLKPTEEAEKVMRQFGIPIGASALQAADFSEVLLKLAKAAQANPDAMAEMIPNIRALTAVSALGESNIAHMNETLVNINSDIANGTGLMESYARVSKNAANRTKAMWGQLQVMAKVLGDHLLPFFVKAVNRLNKLFEAFERMPSGMQKVILGAAALLATIGPLLLIFSSLSGAVLQLTKFKLFLASAETALAIKTGMATAAAVGNVIATKAAVIATYAWTAAQWLLNVALTANPVGLVIVAIGALVLWFLRMWKVTGSWTEALKTMAMQIINVTSKILPFMWVVKKMIEWFSKAHKSTGSWSGALRLMGDQVMGFGQRILKFLVLPINKFISAVVKAISIAAKFDPTGKLDKVAAGLKKFQDETNLKFTGSVSDNPFAKREADAPRIFRKAIPQGAAIPAGAVGSGKVNQDNRQYNINNRMEVNEATDGAQIAEQFQTGINKMSQDASQDFQTLEADNG